MKRLRISDLLAAVGFLGSTLSPSPARAVDGVVDINRTVALAGGMLVGDTSGFPVTITKSGSYRLTGNLDLRDQSSSSDLDAIHIDAKDVTLDLNGFAIIGPASCSSGCTLTGTGVGITSSMDNVTVRNGSVHGMGRHGLRLTGPGSTVEAVRSHNNGGAGIWVGAHAKLVHCYVVSNGFNGVLSGSFSSVDQVIIKSNGGDGIAFASGSSIANAVVRLNAGRGVAIDDTDATASVTGSVVSESGDVGVYSADAAIAVSDSVISDNATGITADYGSSILRNVVSGSASWGMLLGLTAGYRENVLTGNNSGVGETQAAGGVELGKNYCGTNTTCP